MDGPRFFRAFGGVWEKKILLDTALLVTHIHKGISWSDLKSLTYEDLIYAAEWTQKYEQEKADRIKSNTG